MKIKKGEAIGDLYRRKGRYKNGQYVYSLNVAKEGLNFVVPAEVREKVEALAWLRGEEGRYSYICRFLLTKGVEEMIAELSPREREMFENRILPNVKINREIHRKQSRERMHDINRILRAAVHDDETQFLGELTEDDEIPAP